MKGSLSEEPEMMTAEWKTKVQLDNGRMNVIVPSNRHQREGHRIQLTDVQDNYDIEGIGGEEYIKEELVFVKKKAKIHLSKEDAHGWIVASSDEEDEEERTGDIDLPGESEAENDMPGESEAENDMPGGSEAENDMPGESEADLAVEIEAENRTLGEGGCNSKKNPDFVTTQENVSGATYWPDIGQVPPVHSQNGPAHQGYWPPPGPTMHPPPPFRHDAAAPGPTMHPPPPFRHDAAAKHLHDFMMPHQGGYSNPRHSWFGHIPRNPCDVMPSDSQLHQYSTSTQNSLPQEQNSSRISYPGFQQYTHQQHVIQNSTGPLQEKWMVSQNSNASSQEESAGSVPHPAMHHRPWQHPQWPREYSRHGMPVPPGMPPSHSIHSAHGVPLPYGVPPHGSGSGSNHSRDSPQSIIRYYPPFPRDLQEASNGHVKRYVLQGHTHPHDNSRFLPHDMSQIQTIDMTDIKSKIQVGNVPSWANTTSPCSSQDPTNQIPEDQVTATDNHQLAGVKTEEVDGVSSCGEQITQDGNDSENEVVNHVLAEHQEQNIQEVHITVEEQIDDTEHSSDVTVIRDQVDDHVTSNPSNEDASSAQSENSNQTVEISSDIIVQNLTRRAPRKRMRGKSYYTCNRCQKPFLTREDLKEHRKIHIGEKRYECETCHKKFLYKSFMESHIRRKHTGERPYLCHVCGKMFVDSKDCFIHEESHRSEKHFKCDLCSKTFKGKRSLRAHVRKHELQRKGIKKKVYECELCDRKFNSQTGLRIHINFVHKGIYPFVCEICGRGFRNKLYFKEHKRTHTGERPYACTYCGKTFMRVSGHELHLRTHTGAKPYVCKVCNKGFAVRCNLKNHMSTHSKDRPFVCTVCGKGYKARRTLKKHTLTHS